MTAFIYFLLHQMRRLWISLDKRFNTVSPNKKI
jgi:hypothetical protein